MYRIIITFIMFASLGGFASGAVAQEKRLKKQAVPPAVLAAFTKAYRHAAVTGYSSEPNKGVTTYEVESTEGKIHRDITYAADGTVLELEESIGISELPDQVSAAAKKEYPGGIVLSAEKITVNGSTGYELVVKHGRKRTELRLDSSGKILERE